MRINPVNYNYRNQHQNFKVIGDKIDIYNKVSDEKGFDIWLFKKVKGGMAKINDGYLAILQDKEDGSTIKEFKCGAGEEALKNFKRRLEDSVAWQHLTCLLPWYCYKIMTPLILIQNLQKDYLAR